jgi:hypothetical protein
MSPEKWFSEKAFLWNKWVAVFPPFIIFDGIYYLEIIFPRYHHCFNGGKFMGWVARYQKCKINLNRYTNISTREPNDKNYK